MNVVTAALPFGFVQRASCGGDDLDDACASDPDCSAPGSETPFCASQSLEGIDAVD
jgi:hypothetical protein